MIGSPYPHLAAPGRIGPLELKNRIVKAPQGEAMAHRDGSVSERMVAHYRRIAQGGTALVMIGGAHLDSSIHKSFHGQVLVTDEECISGLAWLADAIRAEGSKAGLQLEHCGRQSFLGIQPIKAPSAVPWPELYEATGAVPQELTVDEIAATVQAYGDAARRAMLAGFDVIEIHGAHGYLITNFLSPHTNERRDHYGGSLENRMRFLLEVIGAIRQQLRPDFPVTLRLSARDYEPDGITLEETVEVCRTVEEMGVDALHISGGDHHTMIYQVAPQLMPRALHADAALAVKDAVSIPVIASGSLTLPRLAEDVLAEGKADFVSLGRPLWVDHEWPRKALGGRAEDIRPCTRCNDGCLDRSFARFRAVTCSVNPTLGYEGQFEIEPASERRRVAVVGAGPAGLEAARVLFLRRHEVVVYERRRLGGRLIEAAAPPFKDDLRAYLEYLVRQVDQLDIDVREEEATADELAAEGFDTVVVATGAATRALDLPVRGHEAVVHAVELDGLDGSDGQTVIVGGGFTGSEAALRLAEGDGHQVILIEAEGELMRGDALADRLSYGGRLRDAGVDVMLSTTVTAVNADAVTVVDGDGSESELPAERVVIAVGYEPDLVLAEELSERGESTVHPVGDAMSPGKIHDAVHSAYFTARLL